MNTATEPCTVRVPAPFPLVARPCSKPSVVLFAARCGCGQEDEARVCRDCAAVVQQQGRIGCSRCGGANRYGVTAELRWDDGSVTVLQDSREEAADA